MINLSNRIKQMECRSGKKEEQFLCTITDLRGIEKQINNISFVHLDLNRAKFESFNDLSKNEVVLRIEFDRKAKCTALGKIAENITVKCFS